jgi:hypothetical protein
MWGPRRGHPRAADRCAQETLMLPPPPKAGEHGMDWSSLFAWIPKEVRTLMRPIVCPSAIPLVYCPIKSFQPASSVERPWPGGEKRRGGRASHHEALGSAWVVAPPVCDHRDVPAHGVLPDPCNASGAAMDACSDTPAGVRRAARAADGGVGDVSHVLSGSPRAPRMHAQRVARCDPYHTRNCVPPKQ